MARTTDPERMRARRAAIRDRPQEHGVVVRDRASSQEVRRVAAG